MVKRMTAMLLVLLVIGLSNPIFVEASTVSYVNQAERFVFIPQSSDLFENFKGLMPGDVRKQEIQVRNDSLVPVNIYLKFNPIDEDSIAFLEQVNLQIKDQDQVYFSDRLAKQGSFSAYKLLAKLEPNTHISLDLVLEVPKSLSKEFMNQDTEIEWMFKVEEVESSSGELPNTDNLPKTGTTTNALYIVSGLLFILVGKVLFGKRKNHHS